MSYLKSILLCVTVAFSFYLTYVIAISAYTHDFKVMDLVANVGTLLICIDLMVFLWYTRKSKSRNLQEYAQQLEQPVPNFVKVCRKIGHFGILLIICSWIVPIING
ncbi:hypothetical protein G9F31_08270 [Acinetobacter sp. 187]|uniref:Uncharacterized protein n=1 Tax=Acinetobacter lanii TaxID=2715163 RepID=A0A6G8S0X6_9GAMM|nr:hypothetical protein [Acinetobacter lanii]NHC03768.1 hypothetical protein [Acinetobacter lanii]QIO07781.1 hypothetical protein G8D99_01205 [Acinetobacter lanii]